MSKKLTSLGLSLWDLGVNLLPVVEAMMSLLQEDSSLGMKDLFPGSATSTQSPVVSHLWENLNWRVCVSKVILPSRTGFHSMIGEQVGAKAHGPLNSTRDNSKSHLGSKALYGVGWGLCWDFTRKQFLLPNPAFSSSFHRCWYQEHSLYRNVLHGNLHRGCKELKAIKASQIHILFYGLGTFFQIASFCITRILVLI